MSRYIDENEVYKLVEPSGTARVHCSQIDSLPRADVVEVRHGEWIKPKNRVDPSDWKECSRCGYYFDVSVGQEVTPYCPECGAYMRGTNDGEK